LWNTGTGCPER